MGNYWTCFTQTYRYPGTMPIASGEPTFDPMFGFPNGRKIREMPVSEEDMIAAKIPHDKRDYCAHKYMELHECKRRFYPMMIKCAHERHEYQQCTVDDTILRMKEYERERRLLARQRRIKERQQASAA